ncbi:MAG: class I SAM-dependent methyltransferase [Planctomycetota bacterium]
MTKVRALHFIHQFLKHPKEIGAIAGTSRFAGRAMASQIGASLNVVEFGGGTGTITAQILKYLPQNGRLTTFEINPKFCEYLRKIDDPRLTVVNDDVANYEKYVDSLECIVSALPLTLFNEAERERFLTIASRADKYIQIFYSKVLTEALKDYFADVKVNFVLLNLPPAFIHICTNPVQ